MDSTVNCATDRTIVLLSALGQRWGREECSERHNDVMSQEQGRSSISKGGALRSDLVESELCAAQLDWRLLSYSIVLCSWHQEVKQCSDPTPHEQLCWWLSSSGMRCDPVLRKEPVNTNFKVTFRFFHCFLERLDRTLSQPIARWVIWGTLYVPDAITFHEHSKFNGSKSCAAIRHHKFLQSMGSKQVSQHCC